MDSDSFHSCKLCSPIHFVMQLAFWNGKNSVIHLDSVYAFYKILHLYSKEIRHNNCSVTLWCFRVCNYIFTFQPLIWLVYPKRFQNWNHPVSRQAAHLHEYQSNKVFQMHIRNRLICHTLQKCLKFLLCPELHFLIFFFTHSFFASSLFNENHSLMKV